VLCATRYGNVMGSRGSVIPLFARQLMAGEPVTVTDPRMTRFLMSLGDSVDLVLHAFAHGEPGDIYIQKSPACTVGDLAQAMTELHGRPGAIRVIGTRHGEKLHETLLSREERARAVEEERYFRVRADDRDLNYRKYFVEGEERISALDDYTSENTERLDVPSIKALLERHDLVHGKVDA
jgi:UDP-N-acetylglucosamine 4,6-dehydratase/5-epimerase